MSDRYKVVEIFDSIDGEGKRTGQPVSFIRLAGCNLRCTYCDTLYALFGEEKPCEYREMTVDEILARVNGRYRRVTLTGGEPLIEPNVGTLIKALSDEGYEVNIETNGACDIKPYTDIKNTFFTIDYKLPSSGMADRMIWDNYLMLEQKDVIKFVVGSEEDAECMIDVVRRLKPKAAVYIGAVYGKYDTKRLAKLIMKTPELSDAKIQIQLHKVIGVL